MNTTRLLLLSSSRTHGTEFLEHCRDWIARHFDGVRKLAFVPYAGITLDWDTYTSRVADALAPLGIEVAGVHRGAAPREVLQESEAVAVGGGNTFQLLNELYRNELLDAIVARVRRGMPYMGWSAGSNVACPTIRTTNDMPVVEPPGFSALGLFPCQINPHFTDARPPGHMGETRSQRIEEFLLANPRETVLGLPEGGALKLTDGELELLGKHPVLFRYGEEAREIHSAAELAFLFEHQGKF